MARRSEAAPSACRHRPGWRGQRAPVCLLALAAAVLGLASSQQWDPRHLRALLGLGSSQRKLRRLLESAVAIPASTEKHEAVAGEVITFGLPPDQRGGPLAVCVVELATKASTHAQSVAGGLTDVMGPYVTRARHAAEDVACFVGEAGELAVHEVPKQVAEKLREAAIMAARLPDVVLDRTRRVVQACHADQLKHGAAKAGNMTAELMQAACRHLLAQAPTMPHRRSPGLMLVPARARSAAVQLHERTASAVRKAAGMLKSSSRSALTALEAKCRGKSLADVAAGVCRFHTEFCVGYTVASYLLGMLESYQNHKRKAALELDRYYWYDDADYADEEEEPRECDHQRVYDADSTRRWVAMQKWWVIPGVQ